MVSLSVSHILCDYAIAKASGQSSPILDPIRISTRHAPKMRMLPIHRIVTRIIKAQYNIPLHAIHILDEQIRDAGAVLYERRADPLALQDVLAVRTRRRYIPIRRREDSQDRGRDEPRGEHYDGTEREGTDETQ